MLVMIVEVATVSVSCVSTHEIQKVFTTDATCRFNDANTVAAGVVAATARLRASVGRGM